MTNFIVRYSHESIDRNGKHYYQGTIFVKHTLAEAKEYFKHLLQHTMAGNPIIRLSDEEIEESCRDKRFYFKGDTLEVIIQIHSPRDERVTLFSSL